MGQSKGRGGLSPRAITAQSPSSRGRGGRSQGAFEPLRSYLLRGPGLRASAAQRTVVWGSVAVFASGLLIIEASDPGSFQAAIFGSLTGVLPASCREPLDLGLARPTPVHFCFTSLFYAAGAWAALWWWRWAWEREDPPTDSGSLAVPYAHWCLPVSWGPPVDASGRARWTSRSRSRSRTPSRGSRPITVPLPFW